MKRTIAILIALCMTFALASCGSDDEKSSAESSVESSAESSVESSAESSVESSAESSVESSAESSQPIPPPTESSDTSVPEAAAGQADIIFDAINSAFAQKYPDLGGVIPNMPMDMDIQYAADTMGISKDLLASGKGQAAGMMTNCDMLLVVEAADGHFDEVKAAMETTLQARRDAFSWYDVMGNGERTKAAKIVTKDNYIALIMVGIMPEEGAPDFSDDVKLAEDTFYAQTK